MLHLGAALSLAQIRRFLHFVAYLKLWPWSCFLLIQWEFCHKLDHGSMCQNTPLSSLFKDKPDTFIQISEIDCQNRAYKSTIQSLEFQSFWPSSKSQYLQCVCSAHTFSLKCRFTCLISPVNWVQAPEKTLKDISTPRIQRHFLKLSQKIIIAQSSVFLEVNFFILNAPQLSFLKKSKYIFLFFRSIACLLCAVREFSMLGEFQWKGKADLSLSSRLKSSHQCPGEFLSANNHSCHCSNVLSYSVIQSTVSLRQKT